MSRAEAEQIYSSREVATLLGLGSAMLRRYAVSYEKVTGAQLPLDRRDGRTFSERDVAVLSQARNLVATQGLPVDKALEMVLAQPESAPKPLVSVPAVNGEALAAVLTQAITEAQKPLLGELSAIRAEVEALRRDADRDRELEPPAKRADTEQHGPLVRLALWVERKFRRVNG